MSGAAFKKTFGEMFALIGADVPQEFYDRPFPTHVATDSRSVRPGGAFVALEGAKVDGHKFVAQAAERGAALIVVRRGKRAGEIFKNACVIELDDPEADLARLASKYLALCYGDGAGTLREIVAVTGSVGKTTTRTALERVCAGPHVHAATGSLNTRIGCTATVLAMPTDTELLLLEFGANKPGEIKELVDLFPPTTAIVTQIAPVHLEGFGTVQGVLAAKMEIAGSRCLKRFLYNADNELLRDAAAGVSVECHGVGANARGGFVISECRFDFDPVTNSPSLAFRLGKSGTSECADVTAAVWGEHVAMPLALAAAVGNCLGMTLTDCAAALRDFTGLPGRGRIVTLEAQARASSHESPEGTGTRFIVDDAYNANPASMRASLETFVGLKRGASDGCLVAILGEMREMGDDAPKYHAELSHLIERLDGAILVGDQNLWRLVPESERVSHVATWQEALENLNSRKGDWRGLLVKGSLSVGLLNIVSALTGLEGGAH